MIVSAGAVLQLYLVLSLIASHCADDLECFLVLIRIERLEAERDAEAGPVAVGLDDGTLLGSEGRLFT